MTTATIDKMVGENIVITTNGGVDDTKTRITFADGTTEEYDWSGDFTDQNWISAGIWDDNLEWVKEPVTITFGTAVKRIVGNTTLGISDSLTTVVFTGVTDIAGERMFDGDNALTSVTFSSSI